MISLQISTGLLQVLASVTTVVGLCSVFGFIYIQLVLKRRERSIIDTLDGERIVDPNQVVNLIKQQQTDDGRVAMLDKILKHDSGRRERFLKKVSIEDVHQYGAQSNSNTRWILLIAGVFLLLFSLVAALYNRTPRDSNTSPSQETKTVENDTGEQNAPVKYVYSVILNNSKNESFEEILKNKAPSCDLKFTISVPAELMKKQVNTNFYYNGGSLVILNKKGKAIFKQQIDQFGNFIPLSEGQARAQLDSTIFAITNSFFISLTKEQLCDI